MDYTGAHRRQPIESIARTFVIAVLGLGSLLAAGCSPAPPPATAQAVELEYVGRVVDAATLQPVANAKITLTLEGVPPLVYTDSEGVYRFRVAVRSDVTGQVRVEAAGYGVYTRNITISPTLKTIDDIRLAPEPATVTPFPPTSVPSPTGTPDSPIPTVEAVLTAGSPVSSLVTSVGKAAIEQPLQTGVCVAPGAQVRVRAEGIISVGPNIGSTDADGKDSFLLFGVVDTPIDRMYYSLPAFSHGALLCRVGPDADWEQCGTGHVLVAAAEGCVELAVNDTPQNDNTGSYEVTLEVLSE